jgi:predicted metal-dependent phosphoesterase TrpH
MRGYDLHTHSLCSDGTLAPGDVARLAVARGIAGIALTDHDTTAGIEEARDAARGRVVVLAGCELSAEYGDQPVHVLGIGFDPEEPAFAAARQALQSERVRRAKRMVDRLRDFGASVSFARVRQLAGDASIGRPHIAEAMIEAGVVSTIEEAFSPDWIGTGGRAYVQKEAVSPVRAVALIRGAGGAAVLAHPAVHAGARAVPEAVVREMAEEGLAAIEVDHPEQPPKARARWRALAGELGIETTGGSDDHGARSGYRLGCCLTPEATVEALLAASPSANQSRQP